MPPEHLLHLDDTLRCGVTLAGLTRTSALEHAQLAERLGLDSLWATDHLAFHIPVTDALTLLAFVAGATDRITLGTSIFLAPLHAAAVAAKRAASVDMLSGGRLVLGVGVGGEYPAEFAAAGVPVAERGARVDEAIPLMRRLWTDDQVSHSGRFASFAPISIDPKPAQAGGPPIWIGGRVPAAMRRAGRLGDGYISHMATPQHYARNLEQIRAAAAEANRTPRPFATAAFLFTCIDTTVEAAAARAAAELVKTYAQPFESVVHKYCLLGPPEACVARLRTYIEAGVRHFIIAPLLDPAMVIERLAREIKPALHIGGG